jgi:hypothetical protein
MDLCILLTVFYTANGKTKDSDPTVAGIPLIFLTRAVLIRKCRSQIYELPHTFKEFMTYNYVLIMSYILLPVHEYTLNLISFTSGPGSLLTANSYSSLSSVWLGVSVVFLSPLAFRPLN